jgi:acyl-CoA-binding protein
MVSTQGGGEGGGGRRQTKNKVQAIKHAKQHRKKREDRRRAARTRLPAYVTFNPKQLAPTRTRAEPSPATKDRIEHAQSTAVLANELALAAKRDPAKAELLNRLFNTAHEALRCGKQEDLSKITRQHFFLLYGLYQQVKFGNARGPKPTVDKVHLQQLYDAHCAVAGMPIHQAEARYIKIAAQYTDVQKHLNQTRRRDQEEAGSGLRRRLDNNKTLLAVDNNNNATRGGVSGGLAQNNNRTSSGNGSGGGGPERGRKAAEVGETTQIRTQQQFEQTEESVDRFSALCTEFYQVKENLYNGLEATLTGKNHKRATDIRRKVIAFNAAMDETNSNFTHNNLGMKDNNRGGQQQSGTTNARDVLWRGFGQDGGRDAGGGGAGADAMEGEAGTELK